MTSEEAETIMNTFEKWDTKHAKHEFLSRMERKLNHKEHSDRH